LANAERDLERLYRQLGLPLDADLLSAVVEQFPARVPRRWLDQATLAPELLRQVLPVADELAQVEGFSIDPLGEREAALQPNLLHKYQGRVLLLASPVCAIHCRYCFRRHYPYAETAPSRERLRAAVSIIGADPTLEEVILSGGDPLSLDDARLAELLDALEAIPHLKRLRIHTRLPVVIPERLTDALTQRLARSPLQVVLVLHMNHAAENPPGLAQGLARLRAAGVTLLNQAVLLRDVNDSASRLIDLSESLFLMGVLPYYLHLLDPVSGTAHFQVDEGEALVLLDEMRRRLPGYLVPKLVREEAGGAYKSPIS